MQSSTFRIAVIGGGWVSTHRHIPSLQKMSGELPIKIMGIIDRTGTLAEDLARQLNLPLWSNCYDLDQVDWLSQIDAVMIATSPFSHATLACQALKLGKHVLTEKPFALKVSEGEDMVRQSEQSQKTLSVVHNFQFSRCGQKLVQDLKENRFGSITSIEAMQLSNPGRRLPVWYENLRGGLFFDESPHLLYLIRLLGGGRPTLRAAFSEKDSRGSPTPALLSAQYLSPSKVPIRLTMNFVAPVSEWHILVCGEKAMGIIDIFRNIYVVLPNDGLHVASTVLRTSFLATLKHWSGHLQPGWEHIRGKSHYGNHEVMKRFLTACLENKTPQGISAQDGLEVLKMQHELMDACQL